VDTPEENREGSVSELLVTEVVNEPVSTIENAANRPWIRQCILFVGIMPAEAFYFQAAEAPRGGIHAGGHARARGMGGAATTRPHRAQARPQRSLPLRQRQEGEALLRVISEGGAG
jgi:hypothetical protein